jgi:hypothetical protein
MDYLAPAIDVRLTSRRRVTTSLIFAMLPGSAVTSSSLVVRAKPCSVQRIDQGGYHRNTP